MSVKYLGDGLYADFDGSQVELYASNGIAKTNQVFLDPYVLQRFLDYVDTDTPYGGINA